MRLDSNTKLDCQGNRLTPVTEGSDLSRRSEPEVAIFLNGVRNVQIQNCVLDGFDFGIFAIKSKVPVAIRRNPLELARRRNRILGNTVRARFLAIGLASVDNTEIRDNPEIKYTAAGGRGIYVGRDSDLNSVRNNTIKAEIASSDTPAVGAPGPAKQSTNPAVSVGQAVLVTQILGPEPTLLNAIIEGELHQLPVAKSAVPNGDFSEDNVVTGNTVVFTQLPFDGIVIAIAPRTIVRSNTVSNAAVSIRMGIQSGPKGSPRQFPGKCTAPAGRLCLNTADCSILGTLGTCSSPPPSRVQVFWVSDANLIEGNKIVGPFNVGIATTGSNTIIRGNTITGPVRSGQGVRGGINLAARFALETTTVTRNVVSNVATPLLLINTNPQLAGLEAKAFGAKVSLNDFTGYTNSVRAEIAATLSANGRGNFWDRPCPQGFDPTTVQRGQNLPPDAVVTDDHPFGEPVARPTPGSTPQPCR